MNDHVAAGYDRKVYIGKVFKIEKMWVDFVNILYVILVSAETKRGKKFEKFVPENVTEKFPVWKDKS